MRLLEIRAINNYCSLCLRIHTVKRADVTSISMCLTHSSRAAMISQKAHNHRQHDAGRPWSPFENKRGAQFNNTDVMALEKCYVTSMLHEI